MGKIGQVFHEHINQCFYYFHVITQGKNVIVFYGSQTGTAEEFATRLAKDAARYGMKGMVADPEECDMVGVWVSDEYMNM